MTAPATAAAQPGPVLRIVRPLLIRTYRVVGTVVLVLMLVGLLAFFVGEVFAYVDRSWARPMVLSPGDPRVVEATRALADANLQRTQLDLERQAAVAQLAKVESSLAERTRFEAEAQVRQAQATSPTDRLLLDHAVATARAERSLAEADRQTRVAAVASLEQRLAEQDQAIARLAASPYVLPGGVRRTLVFVPYPNLERATPGAPVFGCRWGLLGCDRVGEIGVVLEGEVEDQHPDGGEQRRGVMVDVRLDGDAATAYDVLYMGAKPFGWR